MRSMQNAKPNWVAENIVNLSNKTERDKPKIVCLGLAFKTYIDDLRETPAIEVLKRC